MGKNLKGKEIGKGICQRKDGLYTQPVRAVDDIHFLTVAEQRQFLEHASVLTIIANMR